MIDREKVKTELDEIVEVATSFDYVSYAIIQEHCLNVLALLKEQDEVEPKKVKGYNPPMYTIYEYECEKCKSPMMSKQPFCMGCGKAVKWDEL